MHYFAHINTITCPQIEDGPYCACTTDLTRQNTDKCANKQYITIPFLLLIRGAAILDFEVGEILLTFQVGNLTSGVFQLQFQMELTIS